MKNLAVGIGAALVIIILCYLSGKIIAIAGNIISALFGCLLVVGALVCLYHFGKWLVECWDKHYNQ